MISLFASFLTITLTNSANSSQTIASTPHPANPKRQSSAIKIEFSPQLEGVLNKFQHNSERIS